MKPVGEVEAENYGFWVGKPQWMTSAQQMACCCMHEKFMVKVTCSSEVPTLQHLPCYLRSLLNLFGWRNVWSRKWRKSWSQKWSNQILAFWSALENASVSSISTNPFFFSLLLSLFFHYHTLMLWVPALGALRHPLLFPRTQLLNNWIR